MLDKDKEDKEAKRAAKEAKKAAKKAAKAAAEKAAGPSGSSSTDGAGKRKRGDDDDEEEKEEKEEKRAKDCGEAPPVAAGGAAAAAAPVAAAAVVSTKPIKWKKIISKEIKSSGGVISLKELRKVAVAEAHAHPSHVGRKSKQLKEEFDEVMPTFNKFEVDDDGKVRIKAGGDKDGDD